MAERQISAGLEAAWQIAADLALQHQCPLIDPTLMLFGLVALEKRSPQISAANDAAKAAELQLDQSELHRRLQAANIDAQEIRRRIRQTLSSSASPASSVGQRVVSRSPDTKRAFEAAIAAAAGVPATPVHLLTALLNLPAVADLLSAEEIRRLQTGDPIGSTILIDDAVISTVEQNQVAESLDASIAIRPEHDGSAAEKLIALCEITWQFGAGANLETFLQEILRELLRLLPNAERASVLMLEEEGSRLLLKAHLPSGTPAVSVTSVSRALESKSAFIWQREQDVTTSQQFGRMQAGIYAPLIANNEALGVIYLDSTQAGRHFTRGELSLVVALAHQVALAIANSRLQLKLRGNAQVLERLLTNFSPRIRKRLLERAQQGKLRLGGERSSVTILCSDIRGFTRLSATMDAEEVVAMLNDYFLALTECIFRNDGTVDKFVGDAILAVFGSPDPDPHHHRNAVKAAVEMQAAMQSVNQRRSARGEPVCEIGVGVHTGDVLHGFIGSPERMEYTIIGDAVNRTSRLCDGAGPGEVVISNELHQYVWNFVTAAPASIPTKHEGTLQAYRVERLRT